MIEDMISIYREYPVVGSHNFLRTMLLNATPRVVQQVNARDQAEKLLAIHDGRSLTGI
jgi:hypothetical protein